MDAAYRTEELPSRNRLLPVLLLFFVFIHIMLCMYIDGHLYTPNTDAIELNLKEAYQPSQRQIPPRRVLPHHVLKTRPALPEPIAPLKPPPIHSTKALKPALRHSTPHLKAPDPSVIPDSTIVPFEPRKMKPGRREVDPKNYFDIVRSSIDAYKIYPRSARKRLVEGSVVVRFIIAASGKVASVDAIGGSSSETLRQAAIDAVWRASPFPAIPGSLGKDTISLKLTIHFKLDR